MDFVAHAARTGLWLAGLAVVAAGLGLSAAQAQEAFSDPRNIYIDGSTPVDARTRALVDAYFDQLENRERARAEERERFQRFIHHDNISGAQQLGRF